MVGMSLLLAPAAQGNTYAPNKTGDHAPNGCSRSDCTLREAVIKANHHGGGDTIVLASGKTYKLSYGASLVPEDQAASKDLDVRGTLTVRSSGSGKTTVDAQHKFRAFETFAPATFRNLVVKRGDAYAEDPGNGLLGGGLFTDPGGRAKILDSRFTGNFFEGITSGGAPVAISRSTISGNSTGVTAQSGTVSISRSAIAANQQGGVGANTAHVAISRSTIVGNTGGLGALYVNFSASVSRSTIRGNTNDSGVGGGILVYGTLGLRDSTVSGNFARDGGGGIAVPQGTASLVNDTVYGNRTNGPGGGIDLTNTGAATLNAVTVTRNVANADGLGGETGGGLFTNLSGSFTSVANSIVALNSGGLSPDCSGTVTSAGENLVGNSNGCSGGAMFSSLNGDFVDAGSSPLGLDTLKNNGGPTKTVAISKSSKARNRAGSDAPSRDQRGVKRSNPDIGAFERI
jgi:hypothetical protein